MVEDDRQLTKKLIFGKLKNTNLDHVALSSSATASGNVKRNPFDKLATSCGFSITSSAKKRPMTLNKEISNYIKAARDADDFQQFWALHGKELPHLSNLVRRTNVIPATSISSEAVFSVASFLQRKQRSSMLSTTLRYLLVLKNRQVLEKFEKDY